MRSRQNIAGDGDSGPGGCSGCQMSRAFCVEVLRLICFNIKQGSGLVGGV